ncbi:MAG: BatA domain-containing protein [Candidatus Omnitrophota bacterium]|nr:BatA domain-containing protein [Candidatus Omnitrophota bacterium]
MMAPLPLLPLFFQSPWFLAGLVSLTLPFLLLLTKSRTYRTTSFSSVDFLRTVTQRASRVIEMKRLILLLVRMMLLALLAAAFALPFTYKNAFFSQSASRDHLIVVLDRSYSMSYRDRDVSLFEKAKSEIRYLLRDHKIHHPYVSLYVFDSRLEQVVERSRDYEAFEKHLAGAEESGFAGDITALTQKLEREFRKSDGTRRSFYVYSDLSVRDKELFEASLAASGNSLDIHWRGLEVESYRNFVIEDIVLPPHPFVAGEEGEINVLYRSYGYTNGEGVDLNLWVDDRKVETLRVILSGPGAANAAFRYLFPGTGTYPIRVEAGPDPVSWDNVRRAVAEAEPRVSLLAVEAKTYAYPFDSPIFFFSHALQSRQAVGDGKSWVEFVSVPTESLADLELSRYPLILITDHAGFGPRLLSQLRYYVKEGGNVLFSVGNAFDAEGHSENGHLEKFLGGHFGQREDRKPPADPMHLGPLDYSQPLLKIFEAGRFGDLARIPFRALVPFIPAAEAMDQKVLLWLDSKWPVLVEQPMGQGRVFVWTTSLNHDWNDFPKDPLYVPFVNELLKYIVLPNAQNVHALVLGEKLVIPQDPSLEYTVLKTPAGEPMTFYPSRKSEHIPLSANTPGFYEWAEVYAEKTVNKVIASNVDARESLWNPVTINGGIAAPKAGTQSLHAEGSRKLSERMFLYMPMLYGALFLLLCEAWLANRFYQPRWV